MQVDKCPTHLVDLIPTRSGPERLLCPKIECDFHYMTGKGNADMTKVTIPKNASKEERAKAIEAAAKAKKATPAPGSKEARKEEATAPGVVKPSKSDRKAKIPKELNKTSPRKDDTPPTSATDIKKHADKELDANVEPKKKEAADPNMLTVSDVARSIGMDPKAARAKLRRDGSRATEGRWPKVRKDSEEHLALLAILQPPAEDSNEDADEEEVEEESNEDAEDGDEDEDEDE